MNETIHRDWGKPYNKALHDFTSRQLLLGYKIKGCEMGGECGTNTVRKRLFSRFFFLWRCDPTRVMASSFLRYLDHTQRRTTVGRTPLDEWSARRRDLYLTTHKHSQQRNIHAPGGIRTHDLSRGAAADLRLRPRGHWDRRLVDIDFE